VENLLTLIGSRGGVGGRGRFVGGRSRSSVGGRLVGLRHIGFSFTHVLYIS
jgi:hypothetical protein